MIHSKLSAATVAGAVSILIVAALAAFGIVLDASTAQALTTLIAFAAGYFHKGGDQANGL